MQALLSIRDRIESRDARDSRRASPACVQQPTTQVSITAPSNIRHRSRSVRRRSKALPVVAKEAEPRSAQPECVRPPRAHSIMDLLSSGPAVATASAFRAPTAGGIKHARSFSPRPVQARKSDVAARTTTSWCTDNLSRPPGAVPPQGTGSNTTSCRRTLSLCDLARSSIEPAATRQRRTYSQRNSR